MRRARRAGKTKGSRHLSLSATDAEWAVVRRNADRRGLSIARYLVGLVERGGSEEGTVVALSPDEQRELLRSVREIRALMLGLAVPEETVPEEPAAPEPAPEEPVPEDVGYGGEAEKLRREIRDLLVRADALIADRPGVDTPLDILTGRRRRIEALLAEARAMEAGDGPHAPHLAAMRGERAALAEAVSGLNSAALTTELLEIAGLTQDTAAFARETGGIAYDAPNYGRLMERVRSMDGVPGLPEEVHEMTRRKLDWDTLWREDRKRVRGFVDGARAFLRARDDLAGDIRALYHPAGGGPPRELWRVQGDALLEKAEKIGKEVPRFELHAHLKAGGEEPGAYARLTAQLRARLGLDPEPGAGPLPDGRG